MSPTRYALVLALTLFACSSRERAAATKEGSGHVSSHRDAAPKVERAKLPWQPLAIDGKPVLQVWPVPLRSDGTFVDMGGRATTEDGEYSLFWKLDKLDAIASRGRRSLPNGFWLTDVESQGEKFVLSLGTSDAQGYHFSTFETADEPIEVVAQIGELRFRVLLFREGERWRIARSTDEGVHWRTDVLPMKGANVASAVGSDGIDVALAWNEGEQGRWLHLRDDSAEKRKLVTETLPGKITSTCSNEVLWVATSKNTLQPLPNGEPHTFASAPTIIGCNVHNALVKLADGSAQLCGFECKPATLPSGEPTVQALIEDDLVAVEQNGDTLAITKAGKRTEYDAGGVVQRMQLIDFNGTPVLVAYGREGLDPTRWAVIP
ncbi:MAG TPA: hypothetical protein VL326_33725 [Kofleriaceae bacterium]|nr:hypothetical protein [Kofleriaceae bacterium]